MDNEIPGHRIRAKRDALRMSQAELGRLVGLTGRAINRIEAGLMPIAMIEDSYLPEIAGRLGITVEYIQGGELQSERSTRDELLRMRAESEIRSDDELRRLDELAAESIRQRNNAKIPLNRAELLALLEVIRGTDGY